MSRSVHEAVYRRLVHLAHACGGVSGGEKVVLERYRRALRIRRGVAEGPEPPANLDLDARERTHILRMLLHVALVDGRISEREDGILREVAHSLGASDLEFESLLMESQQHADARRRALLRFLGLVALVLLAMGVWFLRPGSTPPDGPGGALGRAAFKTVERDARGAVFLILCEYDLVRGETRTHFTVTGSGFLVTPLGHVVTNRHVVESWRHDETARQLCKDGAAVDLGSVQVAAWPGGAHFRTTDGHWNLATAFSTRRRDLRVEPAADREVADREVDLAVLRVKLPAPAWPLRLSPAEHCPASLDEILLLGFPRGVAFLETELAEPTPCLGSITTVQKHIFVNATTLSGISGGPLLDAGGRVLGVACRAHGSGNVGMCIPAREVGRLLPGASELLAEAERFEREDRPGMALDLIALAVEAAPDVVRSRLRATSDKHLAAFRTGMAEAGKRALSVPGEPGRASLRQLVERYGPWWGREAQSELQRLADAER